MLFSGSHALELLVLLVVIALILGSKRFPQLRTGAGRMVKEYRKATHELTDPIHDVTGHLKDALTEARSTRRPSHTDGAAMAGNDTPVAPPSLKRHNREGEGQ